MRIPPGVALALAIGIAAATCARRPVAPAPAIAPVAAVAAAHASAPPPDTFQSEVKPLLLRKCSPCHAPGGKMYERMPFDQPSTVRDHQAGILRRLKAEGEPVERWLAAQPR